MRISDWSSDVCSSDLQWNGDKQFIEDVMRFLDNVLQDYIDRAPPEMARAKYSASRERSVGLGVMGFHSFLQARGLGFESALAKSWYLKVFKHINRSEESPSELQSLMRISYAVFCLKNNT